MPFLYRLSSKAVQLGNRRKTIEGSKMVYPYNDANVRYDYTKHRYILTKEGVLQELNVNLDERLNVARSENASRAADHALDVISKHVYNFIYSHNSDKLYLEYLLAKYAPCRQLIIDVLFQEVEYALDNGTFWNYGGVNLTNGQVVDLSALRGQRVVSYDTEMKLYQRLPNGVCLLYQGQYTYPKFNVYEGY